MTPRPPAFSRRVRYDRVTVGQTPRCGKGLFAAAALKAGQAVGRIRGEAKPPGYTSEYCMGYRDGAIEPDAPYRYINHSCDPNCELIEWEIDGGEGERYYELWLHAKRAVGIGEELTIDYAAGGAVRTDSSAVCLCGSPNCRGFI